MAWYLEIFHSPLDEFLESQHDFLVAFFFVNLKKNFPSAMQWLDA